MVWVIQGSPNPERKDVCYLVVNCSLIAGILRFVV